MRLAAWLCLFALLSSAVLAKPAGRSTKALSGVVTDADGKPLPGISVWAVSETWSIEEGQKPDRLTGADGRFSIPRSRLTPKSQIAVCAAGFETKVVDRPGGKPLKIALQPGPGARIAGRVVDQTGKPVAKFRLMAVMAGTRTGCALRGPMLCPPPDTYAMSQSDAQGRFVLETLQPGWYRVSGSERGYRSYFSDPIRIAPGQRFDQFVVTVQEGAVVTGSVLSSDGKPVAGARISDKSGYFGVETTSDAQGHFRLGGLAAGMKDLFVDHPTLGAAQSRLDLPDGETRLDLRLTPDGEIRGRVLAPDGSPVAGALVSTDERSEMKVQTGADGTFVLRAHAGPVILDVQSDRGVQTKVPAVVAADHPLSLEIRQAPGADISGRISGLKETWGGVGAQVWAHRQDGTAAARAQPDSEGIYHLLHLEPGAWIVEIDDSGERGLPGEQDHRIIFNGRTRRGVLVQAEEGKEAHVDFDFPPLVLVRGHVVGAANPAKRPGDLEWVGWRRADGTEGASYLDEDGSTFTLILEPGSYDIASLRQGAAPILLHLDVKGAQAEPIELHLQPETVLTGQILGLAPGQIAEAVHAEGTNGFPHVYGKADQDGGYHITGLAPGTWTITAEVEEDSITAKGVGHRKITQLVTVPPGAATLSQDLTFSTGSAELTSEDLAARPRSPCG